MKKLEIKAIYEKPEMQMGEISVIDVITSSGDEPFPGDDDTWA